MNYLVNTFKTFKKKPHQFLGVTSGVNNIMRDFNDAKRNGFSYSLLAFSATTALTVAKNVKDIMDEVADEDKIVIAIDPEDDVMIKIITEWATNDSPDAIYDGYQVSAVEYGRGSYKASLTPFSEKSQKISLDNGHNAVLRIERIPVMKNNKETNRYNVVYSVFLDTEDDYRSFKKSIEKKVESYVSDSARPLHLYTNNLYGFTGRNLPKRDFDSVILKRGQSERIAEFLTEFIENKDAYEDIGFPHRTGILFEGPPGTGKTSIVTGIANKFRKNVYQIQLSSVDRDSELNELFSDIPPNSIVLLEDIDIATSKGKNRDDAESDDNGISLAALLNVIDGNFTPPNVITIMTTNKKEALDPALTRPGRIDLNVTVDYLDNGQLEDMCKYYLGFVPEGIPAEIYSKKIAPAKVITVFKENIRDKEKAGKEIVELLTKDTDID